MNKVFVVIYLTITFPLVYIYNIFLAFLDTIKEMKKEYNKLTLNTSNKN